MFTFDGYESSMLISQTCTSFCSSTTPKFDLTNSGANVTGPVNDIKFYFGGQQTGTGQEAFIKTKVEDKEFIGFF